MAALVSYQDNPAYYKQLIQQINREVDFPTCLQQSGYTLIQKSAGSMEFENDKDRLVLHLGRNPMTYFNRNDAQDKGLFFNYLKTRTSNFYKAVEIGLEIINHSVDLFDTTTTVTKKKKPPKSLEENYNIVKIIKPDYLTNHRGISASTIVGDPFKGRIFNAFHMRDNGGKIANIAFPKFDLEESPRNYILYNKPYKSKVDNKIKKFRLVLNQKDQYLFYSNRVKGTSVKIVFGESGIDLLSYHELHGNSNNMYVSFGGNIYQKKLEFFIALFKKEAADKKVEVISITDNDAAGEAFDLKVFAALINSCNSKVCIQTKFSRDWCSIRIQYEKQFRHKIIADTHLLNKGITSNKKNIHNPNSAIWVSFSDKIVLEFPIKKQQSSIETKAQKTNHKNRIERLSTLYLPFPTQVHKSKAKDWNDDLLASKSTQYVLLENLKVERIAIADKIKLKADYGPEGAPNEGIVKEVKSLGLVCDFGLKYPYAIPFTAIAKHYTQKTPNTSHSKNSRPIKAKKTRNLKNHM